MSADALRDHFLGWQCRIRQIAMRQDGGRPSPGMRPGVRTRDGRVLSPAVTVLLLPAEPRESTAFFKFQVQRSNDAREVYDRALAFLQADFFQEPHTFSDRLYAVFPEEFGPRRRPHRGRRHGSGVRSVPPALRAALPRACARSKRRRARGRHLAQPALQSFPAGDGSCARLRAGMGSCGRGAAASIPPPTGREIAPQNFRYASFNSARGWLGEVWNRTRSSRASMSRSC